MTSQNFILLVLMVVCIKISNIGMSGDIPTRPDVVSIGAFCSFNSTIGKAAKIAISAAVDDVNSSSEVLNGTKLKLSMQDTDKNVFLGIVEALDFMENETVAIIGPQFSVLARVISHFANELQVPLLSFAATDPSLSSLEFPFLVRTTQSDQFQMSAIAELVDYFEWRSVVAIYFNDDYGRNGIAVLGDKLAEKRCQISYKAPMSPRMSKYDITNLLVKVTSMESRVLILHTYAEWGLEVFNVAQDLGMMGTGYVWITTDWLSTLLDTNSPLPAEAIDNVQGVLTLRMYTPNSEIKRDFVSRWDRLTGGKSAKDSVGLNAYSLYAYDTVWLLAHAIDEFFNEGNHISFSNDSKLTDLHRSSHFVSMPIFNEGNQLLHSILEANVTGVTGIMRLTKDNCLDHPAYEVINVIGNSPRKVGYWSNYSGLSVVPPDNLHPNPLNSTGSSQQLYGVVWPGQTTSKPRGWVYPNNGKQLSFCIPRADFAPEIIYQVEGTGGAYVGFCIDVFTAVLDLLPYSVPYQFILGTHPLDELLPMVTTGGSVYDAVIGDSTITTNRTRMVDFTRPYIDSNLVVVAPIRKLDSGAWAFLRPFTPLLWCVTGLFPLIVGTVIWILERRTNEEFRGPPRKQLVTILWFSFSTIFFADGGKTVSNLSRFLLLGWLFVVLILNSTYTASLSSILTVEQLSSPIKGIDSLISSNEPIGYLKGSFSESYLTNELNIHHSRLVPLMSLEEYEDALNKGPQKGGVAAVVDERVYMEIFLSTRCKFSIVGRDFAKLGWGFAFRKDSPLVEDMSTAILTLSENGELQRIRDKWLRQNACSTEGAKEEIDRLQLKSFWGLFFLFGLASFLALMLYFMQILFKFIKHYSEESRSSGNLRSRSAVLHSFVSFMSEKEHAGSNSVEA